MRHFTLLFFAVISVLLAAPVHSQTVVTDNDITRQAEYSLPTDNWVGYTRNTGTLTFAQGPGVAPSGGSLQFATPSGSDKAYLYNYDHIGTKLSDITGLAYSTYRTSGAPDLVPSINIEIDYNGPAAGGFAILIFEPAYNADQGMVTDNTWQTWDAFNGGNAIWWSAMAINGVCDFSCYVPWDSIVAKNPQAEILRGFGLSQGSGNVGLASAVDNLAIAKNGAPTVYNFEPAPAIPTPLPVTWLYFKGQATDSGNHLTWATATENNSSHFVVERSLDGLSFEAVTEIKAAGNSSQQRTYTFLDKNATVLTEKTVYYRLKQTDLDANFIYSSVISITRKAVKTGEAFAHPNPFTGALTLELPLLKEPQIAHVELRTLTGKTAYRKEILLPAGNRKFELGELQELPAGLYLLRLEQQDKLTAMKVIKQ